MIRSTAILLPRMYNVGIVKIFYIIVYRIIIKYLLETTYYYDWNSKDRNNKSILLFG